MTELLPDSESFEDRIAPVPFHEYRALCDMQTDSFRRLGILSPEAYTDALQDPRTIMAMHENRSIPVLTPIEYEDGYDAHRCRELTGRNEVLLMSVPLSALELDTDGRIRFEKPLELEDNTAVIIEKSVVPAEDSAAYVVRLTQAMSPIGTFMLGQFKDPRVQSEAHQAAAMSLFEFPIRPRETTGEVRSYSYAWQEYMVEHQLPETPTADSEDTYLFDGNALRHDPETLDALWAISEVGFGDFLGKHHPVSMEESREFFDDQLLGEGVFTAVRFHEGKPVCFGSLVVGMENCSWFNLESDAIKQVEATAPEGDEPLAYFSEIISNGEKGARYSPDVLGLHMDLAARTAQPHSILFESTNLSAQYIPAIIGRVIDESPVELARPIETLAKLDYYYLTSL